MAASPDIINFLNGVETEKVAGQSNVGYAWMMVQRFSPALFSWASKLTPYSKKTTKTILGQLFSLGRLRPSDAKEDQSNKFQRLGFNVLQQFTFDPSSSDFLNPRRRLELRIFITQLPSGN
jgi:hypothetical protein